MSENDKLFPPVIYIFNIEMSVFQNLSFWSSLKYFYFKQEDIMFEKLNSLFVLSAEKPASGKSSVNSPVETKKCKKCLRRISVNFERCPYCRSDDFQFNDA